MDTLTIHAATPESARAMHLVLSGFQTELVETAGGYELVITFSGRDSEIVDVLNALQNYVSERGDGPARVDFHGNSYVMHPEPGSGAERQ